MMSDEGKPGRKPWRLTDAEVAEAEILHDQGMSWNALGRMFNCDSETVRRLIDPQYFITGRGRAIRENQRKREERARLRAQGVKVEDPENEIGGRCTTEANERHKRAIRQNEKFTDAMMLALSSKRERCPIGVDKRPSSPDGRYHPARYIPTVSLTGSSAGMCSDLSDPMADNT